MEQSSPLQKEIEPRPIDMPALQARMLLGDQKYLNPEEKTEAPLLKKETVPFIKDRNYGLFEEASKRERKATQNQENTSFDEKYKIWSDTVVDRFNADENKQRMDILKPLLFGMLQGAKVTEADVKKLFDAYLDTTSSSSGIKGFVRQIIQNYEDHTVIDIQAFERDRESIKWIAQLFGSTSSEMIDQLITAEMKLLSDPDKCYEELNKTRNFVSEPEKRMMGFIYNKEVAVSADATENGRSPMEGYEAKIKEALQNPDIDKIIISAGTGAGKTRKVPQYVKDILVKNLEGEKVAVTQPRRLPTEEVTEIIAEDMDTKVGEEVGWKHGKGKKVSKESKIIFTVEGSLLRKLADNATLPEYNYVMVDEWHERHQDTDILVGLLLRAQKLRKEQGLPALKIIITSATMDSKDLQQQLGETGTKLFEIGGRQHHIDRKFEERTNVSPMSIDTVAIHAAEAAKEMLKSRPSDRHILIFMPGDHQIKDTHKELLKLGLNPDEVTIDILTGSMTREEQKNAINVSDGKRHIIISTPVAETSLTIKRVDVISSGYVNVKRVDPDTGLEYLETIKHSKHGLKQQEGRTGRESDGMWQFLGTEGEYNRLVNDHLPEILRTDLSDKVLLLKKMGLTLNDLSLIDKDKIPKKNVDRAMRRLKDLDAFDAQGNITAIGKRMVDIPLDIHFSRMIVEAQEKGCIKDAVKMAIVCSQTDFDERLEDEDERVQQQAARIEFQGAGGSDFIAQLRMYKAFEEVGKGEEPEKREELQKQWAEKRYLRYSTLIRAEEEIEELLDRLHYKQKKNSTDVYSEQALAECIFKGFRDNLLIKTTAVTKGDRYNDVKPLYRLEHERLVNNGVIDSRSNIHVGNRTPEYIVSAGNYPRQKRRSDGSIKYIRMQMNQAVDPSWLTA